MRPGLLLARAYAAANDYPVVGPGPRLAPPKNHPLPPAGRTLLRVWKRLRGDHARAEAVVGAEEAYSTPSRAN